MNHLRILFFVFGLLSGSLTLAQGGNNGVLTGNLLDESSKALEGATVELLPADSLSRRATITGKDGSFYFGNIPFGYYFLRISYTGLQALRIDSLYFREDRSDFNLNDLVMKSAQSSNLQEVIIYSEKPLVESKDGNIIFNAGESALAAGSNASDLLASVPLVAKDGDGKITVRGKEPRILIDDKPVELNLQQLQDLLESMPGSAIEKIEVMTNPPPQYANEQGGVINIVTRKGRVGKSGRISLSGGSRGEVSTNGSYLYRKQGLSFSLNAGASYNRFTGNGYSSRENIYADSSNFLNTQSRYVNRGVRPNLRANIDYDLSKYQSLNATLQLNANDFLNQNWTEYRHINRFGDTYRLSDRTIRNEGDNFNGSLQLSYRIRSKRAGEQLRLIADLNRSLNASDRDYYQQFFHPNHTPNGIDSTQEQSNRTRNSGYNFRANYDRPLIPEKTFLSFGSFYTRYNSDVNVEAGYYRKPDGQYVPLEMLENHLRFHQTIVNLRAGLRQNIARNFSISAGTSLEQTNIWFELIKEGRDARNSYWTWLPYANMNKRWENDFNLNLAWRRSIRRPGINELNPTIDFSDPYNIRFGNEQLEASTADNFDLVFGRTKRTYFINLGLGYNRVRDIFSRVRTLLNDGKTQVTWENISGRKEYELSTWGGLTLARKLRVNLSASYTYNQYSEFDRRVNGYRNGGSFNSNINSNYSPRDILQFTGGFTFNRFANPQGYARWNWSMNVGAQRKFFEKRLTVTVNVIDPFVQQRNHNYTYGPNFALQSYSETNTRNFRLSIGYNLTRPVKKSPSLKVPGA